jgi:hypothetical protein
MRWMILFAIGCGGPDVHELGACGDWPIFNGALGNEKCERACRNQPANYTAPPDSSCPRNSHPVHPDGLQSGCPTSFEFEGQRGCCFNDSTVHPSVIEFFECVN